MHDFIFTDKIDENICNNLINLFESNSDKQRSGLVADGDVKNLDTSKKNSTDLELNGFNLPLLDSYYMELQNVLLKYIETYPEVRKLPTFNPTHGRIQKYDKDGHYNTWHHERSGGSTQKRCLVYMTYLNDVEEGGYTYFKYQNKQIKPEVGKTVIWPSDWTHTHKGIGPKEGYKYIITGWYVHTEISTDDIFSSIQSMF